MCSQHKLTQPFYSHLCCFKGNMVKDNAVHKVFCIYLILGFLSPPTCKLWGVGLPEVLLAITTLDNLA